MKMGAVTPLQPGAWIGVLGGGQLGRIFALEARRMGYRVCVLDPDPRSPAAQVADAQVRASLDDTEAAAELARRVSVVTYEFEQVDVGAVAAAGRHRPVYPGSRLLSIAQDRIREKETLARLGFPVPAFHPVRAQEDVVAGLQVTGLPAVLKTATGGYDGKGQAVVHNAEQALAAYENLRPGAARLILEEWIDFSKELSVICARNAEGNLACYPAVENIHKRGILDITIAPAMVPEQVSWAARRLTADIAARLDLVGVLAVEMFLTGEGDLLVNELAPRPHNSGHYTLDACACSQFEQLLRAICHLPLGATDLLSPVAMANLLGDLWVESAGKPDFTAALTEPGVKLHLYGKSEFRPGRKMGHLTALAPTPGEALERAVLARARARKEIEA